MLVGQIGCDDLQQPAAEDPQCLRVVLGCGFDEVLFGVDEQVGVEVGGQVVHGPEDDVCLLGPQITRGESVADEVVGVEVVAEVHHPGGVGAGHLASGARASCRCWWRRCPGRLGARRRAGRLGPAARRSGPRARVDLDQGRRRSSGSVHRPHRAVDQVVWRVGAHHARSPWQPGGSGVVIAVMVLSQAPTTDSQGPERALSTGFQVTNGHDLRGCSSTVWVVGGRLAFRGFETALARLLNHRWCGLQPERASSTTGWRRPAARPATPTRDRRTRRSCLSAADPSEPAGHTHRPAFGPGFRDGAGAGPLTARSPAEGAGDALERTHHPAGDPPAVEPTRLGHDDLAVDRAPVDQGGHHRDGAGDHLETRRGVARRSSPPAQRRGHRRPGRSTTRRPSTRRTSCRRVGRSMPGSKAERGR